MLPFKESHHRVGRQNGWFLSPLWHMILSHFVAFFAYILRLACSLQHAIGAYLPPPSVSARQSDHHTTFMLSKVSLFSAWSLMAVPSDPKTYKRMPTTPQNLVSSFNLPTIYYNLSTLTHPDNAVDTPFRILTSWSCGICCPCSFRPSTIMFWSCSVRWSFHYTGHCCPRWCKNIFVAY